ncbi:hypothetical protein SAMN02745116_01789 [Pilibacter termitis]|uniref:Uncharacterized protein n=1 Tax=Pilibacter termitis TaxID=263852 RepID=A0A1T4PGZ4_9ENTE|nr:hypothetical protein [Pilibacter termitis]SJZ90058.1 hypothetical protein SAMN02745116_01789 [Pilibacter termitis]
MTILDVWANKALDEAVDYDSPVNGIFAECMHRLAIRKEQCSQLFEFTREELEQAVERAMKERGYI